MIRIAASPHSAIELRSDELSIPIELVREQPWHRERVAAIKVTRVGYELSIGPYVGRLVVSDDLIIDIRDPFPGTVEHCLELTQTGRRAGGQPSAPGAAEVTPWGAVLREFATRLLDYVENGPHREYWPVNLITSRPRGRIDVPRTARHVHARGRVDLLACRPRTIGTDNALNRLLLAAAVRAAGLAEAEGASLALSQLQHALPFLAGVAYHHLPDERQASAAIPREDVATSALVDLAGLFIAGIPAMPANDDQPIRPFSAWLNAERIFENAVRTIVGGMFPAGTVLRGEDAEKPLLVSEPGDLPPADRSAEPDIVVGSARPVLLDVKYRTHDRLYTEDELYQLMAHATAFDAAASGLLTTAGSGPYGVTWLGRDATGHAFYVLRVDPTSLGGIHSLLAGWFNAVFSPPTGALAPAG